MAVNGRRYDWESVEIQLPHGVAIGIEDIDYGDEAPVEMRYGKGSIPRGYGRKNYKASGSMTLDLDEAEQLRANLGGYYTKNSFTIVVSYGNGGMDTITDTLPEVLITKVENSDTKQDSANAGKMKITFELVAPIQWNGQDAYTDGRDGAPGN